MSKPDSLLVAAKRLADAAGLPWAEVHPYYRALQEPGGATHEYWLPKSQGRSIWAAQPNMIARLIFALAGARTIAQAHDAVEMARDMTPGGRGMHLDELPAAEILAPLEAAFHRYLTDPDAASKLGQIEFKLDIGEIVITGKETITFTVSAENKDRWNNNARRIYTRGVVGGDVFRLMARETKWRPYDQAPYSVGQPGDDTDD